MLLTKTVKITMRNHSRRYRELGYEFKYGDTIEVRVEDLSPTNSRMLEYRCDECGVHYERTLQMANRYGINVDHCFTCARKRIGRTADYTNTIAASKTRTGKNHPRWNENKTAYQEYMRKVRWLSEKTYVDNIDLINPFRLPRTLAGVDGGYQLDHKVKIRTGFEFGINPIVMASVDNLQMLPWKDNNSKR